MTNRALRWNRVLNGRPRTRLDQASQMSAASQISVANQISAASQIEQASQISAASQIEQARQMSAVNGGHAHGSTRYVVRIGRMGGRALLATVLAASAGCHLWPHREESRPADIASGSVPPPPGSMTCAWHQAENAKARGYDWVIAQHQWYQGGEHLGPDGQERLARLAAQWRESTRPVIIEPHTILVRRDLSDDYGKSEPQLYEESLKSAKELDERRRLHIVEQLASRGFEDANDRVVIARPPYDALYGQDAEMAFQQIEFGGVFGGRGGRGIGGGFG
ncbi:MAG: hypothetical protein RLY70_4893, partial [Planctomycetota bacterium]